MENFLILKNYDEKTPCNKIANMVVTLVNQSTRTNVNLVLYLNMVHKRYGLEYALSTPCLT